MDKIRILVVDDHSIIRDGIRQVLKIHKEFEIVAEASNGQIAMQYMKKNAKKVDLILMDVSMPVINGIEATEIILERNSDTKILALTMHAEETYIISMLKAGALGYVLKEETDELVEAIKIVVSGDKYYSKSVAVTMIDSFMDGGLKKSSEVLSVREKQVLAQIAEGATNKEVGSLLCISSRTVETHRRNILGKLGVRNTPEMIKYALKNRLIA